ncbi:uncharacterized protein [Temnothorax longispinosus]|uniref:uncharacterized protein n=1 Tax=Temnothorax longispinosus TaxID=300112 RepID=UPI003A9A17D4
MNVHQFDYLCDLLRPYLTKRSIRTPLPIQLRVAMTLEILARGTSVRTFSWSYRIGRFTAHKVFNETCKVLWVALQPIYLQAPTRETMMQISEDFFNRWQFPNCVGAIDGKHISIQCPPKTGSQFYSSYKKRFSINLMAACDAKYRFTWVDIGDYGSQSDGGVWANCDFGQALDADEIDFPPPKEISGSNVTLPFTFVADEAFPLGIHMMRPYARSYRTFGDEERIFNYRLSRARRVIENAFGIMCSRSRILRKDLCSSVETTEDIVKAVVCLHNFLMISEDDLAPSERTYCPASMVDREGVYGDVIEGEWRRDIYRGPITDVGRLGSNNPTVRADAQRNILKDYFCSDIGQVDWQWEQALHRV